MIEKDYRDLQFFSLRNTKQIKTPSGFVDDSGLVNSSTDPYFGVAMHPYEERYWQEFEKDGLERLRLEEK